MERDNPGAAVVGAPGFSLIEVILVLFVLALATAVALPVVGRTSEAVRIRSEVAGFSATLRHAREQAVATQRPFRVEVNPIEHRMTVVADEADVRLTRPLARELTVQAVPGPSLTVSFDPQGVSSGGDFRLSAGNLVYFVNVDPLTGRVRINRP
ncbi:MAG: GspH/FimT family pseudopilin [Candidatus Rokuibacteriota bacterium]